MEKRLILAISLSLLVLVSWSFFVSRTQPIAVKGVVQKERSVSASQEVAPASQADKVTSPVASTPLNFAQDSVNIVFSEEQAAIKEVTFKKYGSGVIVLKDGFALADTGLVFRKGSFADNKAVFTYKDNTKEIIKRFIFSDIPYDVKLEIEVRNLSNLSLDIKWPLVLGTISFIGDQNEIRFQDITVVGKDKVQHFNGHKDVLLYDVQFMGLRNRYFCSIVEPEEAVYAAQIKRLNKEESQAYIEPEKSVIPAGGRLVQKFRIYLGPQQLQSINKVDSQWLMIMHYGTFNFIAHILLQLLEFLYGLVHSWGWVLIILSVLIYLVLFPLTLKQMRSMKEMQAIQPKVEELRKLYKDNPQRLNKEIMSLYKEHKVNPFGGCLPLLLQIPVFFALYQVLMRSVALKGAQFLWIKDLSQPDALAKLPVTLPVIGNEFNILPIAMAIEMFFQQKVSMAAATGGSREQQQIMLILMPIMFGLIFYRMPSGLVLYWFVNSTLMFIFQWRMNRQK